MSEPSRRAVLTGTGAACLCAIAGCAAYGKPTVTQTPAKPPSAAPTSVTPPSAARPSPAPAAAPAGIAATSDVPAGGGIILDKEDLVLTQPSPGTFKGFSATCTHQGCTVGDVSDGTINCPCHGSKFAIADGSVVDGPAPAPLPSKKITVTGTAITVG